MSNAKHTQGQWIIDLSREKAEVKIGKEYFYFDNKADAILVSAAPELLEALEMMCRALIQSGANEEWDEIIAAKSIIAKARGE